MKETAKFPAINTKLKEIKKKTALKIKHNIVDPDTQLCSITDKASLRFVVVCA